MADVKDAMALLEEMADLLEVLDENPFKVRAFRSASRNLRGLSLNDQTPLEDLLAVKGLGKHIAPLVHEALATGSIQELEALHKKVPPGVREMLRLRGVGPSKVRVFWHDLQTLSVGELAYACRENRLLNLKGFGEKAQANVLKSIEEHERGKDRMLGYRARWMAAPVLAFLECHQGVTHASLCGSLRREGSTAKDADIVVCARHPGQLAADLFSQSFVERAEAHGDTKLAFVLKEGLRVDVRLVPPESFISAVQYFTGSKEHNVALRARAKSMGLKLNEYGLFKNEKPLPLPDETALYHALGLHFIPPPLRESLGEIEAYDLHKSPPPLIETADLAGIFHLHTTASDGAATLEEMVLGAVARGYRYIGISDHSQSSVVAGGLKPDQLLAQNKEVRALQKKYPQIQLFHGVEADILGDGRLDYGDDVLGALDFVIGSVHSQFGLSREAQTQRLVRALSHPHLTMLGHPTGRLLLGREGYDLDMQAVLGACAQHGKVMELNANPLRLDLDWTLLGQCKTLGIPVSINPDAHRVEGYDHTPIGVGQAQKGGLGKTDVFNTLPPEKMKEVLAQAKQSGRVEMA